MKGREAVFGWMFLSSRGFRAWGVVGTQFGKITWLYGLSTRWIQFPANYMPATSIFCFGKVNSNLRDYVNQRCCKHKQMDHKIVENGSKGNHKCPYLQIIQP